MDSRNISRIVVTEPSIRGAVLCFIPGNSASSGPGGLLVKSSQLALVNNLVTY